MIYGVMLFSPPSQRSGHRFSAAAHCFLGLLSHWNKTTYGTPARVCVHTCVCVGGEQSKDRVSSRRAAYLDLYTVPRKSFFIDF